MHDESVSRILAETADYFAVGVSDITGRSRVNRVPLARAVAVARIYDEHLLGGRRFFSQTEVGRMFGGRDHTTISYLIHIGRDLIEELELGRDEAENPA